MSTADAELPEAPVLPGEKPRILLIRAPYYRTVVDGMTKAAKAILQDVAADVESIDVAGAFELPQALRIALRGNKRFDGFIVLGCVVRGETEYRDGRADAGGAAIWHLPRHGAADGRYRGAGGGQITRDRRE
jgi:6,7-dimethyl-8-ribityllumazine synthase